ncbi:MAG: DEAD/DEAH box helicase [Bacilli bacterium]|nr:DEAD/DEAH box helicase [Bacilli bacterium]
MKFSELNLNPFLLKAINRLGLTTLTPIQEKVLPVSLNDLDNNDIIAQAPTGTGKTIAFGLPILNKLTDEDFIQALVLAPTRELANQIKDDLGDYAYYLSDVNVCALYGGEDYEKQFRSLKKHPKIIVATPGRLLDHIRRSSIDLSHVTTLVIDEADEMLDMGFRDDLNNILSSVSCHHQTLLFFATISKGIEEIANSYLNNPKRFQVEGKNEAAKTIKQFYIKCEPDDKIEIISRIIDINEYRLVMIFCNTKLEVDYVTSNLMQRGFLVEGLHGDMKQMQRDNVMNRFRNGNINILVASDVAARGIDIDDVDCVINYSVPTDEENYVHRIGRTGRANKAGLAILLVTKGETYRMKQVVNYSKSKIDLMAVPPLEEVLKARAKRLISKALDTIPPRREELIIEQAIEETIKNEVDGYDLIAGLITLKLQENINQSISSEENHSSTESRIFISVGKKDNYKSSTLVKLIVNISDINRDDISRVDVHDSFSFFTIPSKLLNKVLTSFNEVTTDGKRKVIVEEAKDKGKKTSSKAKEVSKYDYAHHGKKDRSESKSKKKKK